MQQQPNTFAQIGDEILTACRPHIDPNAWGLTSVLRAALNFAWIDDGKHEIVLNYRALALGLLLVGSNPNYRKEYQNTATWFVDWLSARLPGRSIDSVLEESATAQEAVVGAVSKGYRPVPSITVRGLLDTAAGFAQRTMETRSAALRHVFVALVFNRGRPFQIPELKWRLTRDDEADLTRNLLAYFEAEPGPGESINQWTILFNEAGAARGQEAEVSSDGATAAASPSPAPARSPKFAVSSFFADRTDESSGDPLDTDADVLAMARLICHEDADPPISIGIFGGWGSGKTTFMEALQAQVKALSKAAAAEPQIEHGPRFVSPVVQIRFNAWQFADANLWASLTAEFFDQLRAGGFEGGGKSNHARLVEKVNEHVRGLSRAAGERRAELARADDKLRDAQTAHDEAVREEPEEVQHALVAGLAEAFDRNKNKLLDFGLLDASTDKSLTSFVALARDGRTQWGRVSRVVPMLRANGPVLLVLLLVAGLAAATAYVVAQAISAKPALSAAIAALATGAAGLIPLIRRGLSLIKNVVDEIGPFVDRLTRANQQAVGKVLETEVALRSAAAEADALRAASERADRALARYVDPGATPNPPRVLRYLLEDDPDTKAFEKEIGLIGRARRLFEAVDHIVEQNRETKRRLRDLRRVPPSQRSPETVELEESLSAALDREMPDRIILYIDDLDRCTHEQVYRVLQAVHLLLAFGLFVVIVAVDIEWVEAALAKSMEFADAEKANDPGKEKARRQRAIEYLSKIFQLPFWLKPFAGKDDVRYGQYVRSLTRPNGLGAPPPPPASPPEEGEKGSANAAPVRGESNGVHERTPSGRHDSSPTVETAVEAGKKLGTPGPVEDSDDLRRALTTLQLTDEEKAFLASAPIGVLAATDPRGVKRLVNVYKIARARLGEVDENFVLGDGERAPAFPTIALYAAIETGQPHEVAEDLRQQLKHSPQRNYLRDLNLKPEIQDALRAAVEARNGQGITIEEMQTVGRIVRRYSFNKYQ